MELSATYLERLYKSFASMQVGLCNSWMPLSSLYMGPGQDLYRSWAETSLAAFSTIIAKIVGEYSAILCELSCKVYDLTLVSKE